METPLLKVIGESVQPGFSKEILLKISEFYTANPVNIPVVVVNGLEKGPRIFITAAIHGDEINGIEVVRRLINFIDPKKLRGCLICIPIVNIFGFYTMSRNLPDGRDLNKSFPGSEKGSVAARIAHLLFSEIIELCDFGIDIHTPRIKRFEMPHTEADLTNRESHKLARAFGLPVIINTPGVKNSLQQAANDAGIPSIVYSGGEVLRFHHDMTSRGLKGILNILAEWEMYDLKKLEMEYSVIVQEGKSLQTTRGGILHIDVKPGDLVYKGGNIGSVMNPFGQTVEEIGAPETGLIISISTNPLVNPGNEICSYVHLEKSLSYVEAEMNKQKNNS